MALTYKGRLPGVVVEPTQADSNEDSLRMDVAGLVGFAERGPLDTPVRVEDIQQYRAVFGGDVFLARDGGKPIYAQLPRAVQAFFDNGGRHAWVVRVAGRNARPNRLRLPGLVRLDDCPKPDNDSRQGDRLKAVVRPAAWAGRWSDNLSVATRLRRQPLRPYRPWRELTFRDLRAGDPDCPCYALALDLLLSRIDLVREQDVLNLSFDDAQGSEVFLRVEKIEQLNFAEYDGALWEGVPVRVSNAKTCIATFGTRFVLPPAKHVTSAEYYHDGSWYPLPRPISTEMVDDTRFRIAFRLAPINSDDADDTPQEMCCLCEPKRPDELYRIPIIPNDTPQDDDRIRLFYEGDLILDFPAPTAADDTSPGVLLVTSDELIFAPDALEAVAVLDDTGWQTVPGPSSGLIYHPNSRLRRYRAIFQKFSRLIGPNDILQFTVKPARADDAPYLFLFPVEGSDWYYNSESQPEQLLYSQHLWHNITPDMIDATRLRKVDLLTFDLYLREGTENLENWPGLHFGTTGSDFWEGVLARPAGHEANRHARDILGRSRLLGLDDSHNDRPFYLPLGMNEDQPEAINFDVPLPEENRSAGSKDGLDTFDPIALFLDPDFHRNDRDERLRPEEIRALANRKLYFFDPSRPRHLQTPKKLHSLYGVDEVSLIALPDLGHRRWQRVETATFIPYRPDQPPVSDAVFAPCPEPATPQPFIPDLPFRREREQREQFLLESETNTDLYRRLLTLPTLVPVEEDCICDDAELIVVQRALVNMAAARGDITAILSLPLHYDMRNVLDWHQQIVCPREILYENGIQQPTYEFCPRDRLDERTLGYAAAYHGWTIVREERTPELDPLRFIPPDGTVLGMIANRTVNRGPGVAPANDALRGVVGLKPAITDAEWEMLFNRQVNVLRQRPQRFTVLSAHTLSLYPLHRKLSIERLHMYIRKLVLREGERYVFEPNSARFRRGVQRSFERVMARLLQQGALVGYSVDATDRLNSPRRVDEGRFIVEIKYAPTHPVEFITIVLLRSGESLLEVVEGL